MFKKIHIIAGILLITFTISSAQTVSNNILNRVFYVRFNGNSGSAFTIEWDKRQYLISARHIFKGIKDNDEIEILNEKQWKKLKVKIIEPKDSQLDVIALIPPFQISPTFPAKPTSSGLIISQDAYFLGFPYGLYTEIPNGGFPVAFVKKAIFSSLEITTNNFTIIYLDGINNPGFSGGPIVFSDLATKELKIAGVVSGYRTNSNPVINKNMDTGLEAIGNSGIIIGYEIDSAIQMIKTRPEGALIAGN